MSTVLAIIAAVIVLAIIVILILAAMKADTFRVVRTTSIKAPPEKIFPLINDFQKWGGWSPYEKMDPAMKRSFSGPQSGKGASYAWEGKKAGAGSMEITEAKPSSKVSLRLDFTKPFKANNLVDFTMAPRGDSSDVTWDMHGPTPFIGKIMHVFINMDRMVGKDFDTGLANLKTIAEK
jgi:uncharacterized protein YndB with AHSA1/START domain